MADVDTARLELEEALGRTEVLSDPLALTLYARDASMVEGGCALVAFPHTVEDVVVCMGVAAGGGAAPRPPPAGRPPAAPAPAWPEEPRRSATPSSW